MKIAIMTNDSDSFEKPLAEGLHRMFDKLGVASKIFWNGYSILERVQTRVVLSARGLRDQGNNLIKLAAIVELTSYDAVVVVSTVPTAFLKEEHAFIGVLRTIFPRKPIVVYSTSYLATRGKWYRQIKERDAANYGMERYDHYLAASVVSEFPMPEGDNPVSVVGVNLEDPSLRVEPKQGFLALLDFERPDHMKERAIMIEALEETGTKYVVLNGHYPMDAIRSIYRRASAYFIAHRESFGLPICELQACGAYVLSPYSNWAPSHWIKDDLKAKGEGRLSDNFIIYENDRGVLQQRLREIRRSYDPFKVFANFTHHYPQYYHGDLGELKAFVEKVEAKIITGRSHLNHRSLNDKLVEEI